MFLTTSIDTTQDICLNIDEVKEIFVQDGVTIIISVNSGKIYKVTQTLAQIIAQAPRNLFVQVTGTDGVEYLLFDYRILQITAQGTGSRITFKNGGTPRNVTQTPDQIVQSYREGSTAFIPSGPTAARPAAPYQGQAYIDTDINDSLIYYIGSDWVNVTGANTLTSAFKIRGGFTVNATLHASAIAQIDSATQGVLLVPRMTAAQRAAIPTPATGLMVYQTDGAAGIWHYNGATWLEQGANSTAIVLQSGATGSRPGLPVIGQMYLDTTIGLTITYDGADWTNATGAIV